MGAERWLILLAACTPAPDPIVLCHNANCAGDAEEARDDTLGALDDSLALGEAMLDGVEIDFGWYDDRCVFAHEPGPDAPDATMAGYRVAEYLAATSSTPSGSPFVVYVELKPDDAREAELAGCVVDVARTLGAHPFEFVVSSFSATLLGQARDRLAAAGIPARFVAEIWHTRESLQEFTALDAISVHALELDAVSSRRYADLGLEVALWTDLDTPGLFDAIARFAPRYVSVARVEAVRGWLDR